MVARDGVERFWRSSVFSNLLILRRTEKTQRTRKPPFVCDLCAVFFAVVQHNMTRKLVEAQEQERARIARELHDDMDQRLALLAIELEQLQDNPSEIQNRVARTPKTDD